MRNDLFLKEIGRKVRDARKTRKLSLRKLSLLCGINSTSLWILEKGEAGTRVLTLKAIADAMEMDIKEFL